MGAAFPVAPTDVADPAPAPTGRPGGHLIGLVEMSNDVKGNGMKTE